jgi:hypothetical protein
MSDHRLIRAIAAVLVLAVVLCAPSACASAQADESLLAPDPTLASWIASVDRVKLQPIVDDLTGETTPLIGGTPYRIRTRYARSGTPSDMAEQYVYERLLSYGLTSVEYQSFSSDGVTFRNVVGEIPGTVHPEQIVLVGPHLDSESGDQDETLAPGADDNAGSVAVALYMAKVFAHHHFARTIRFVFFDGEEVGHAGSGYYASKAKAAGEDIVAMLAPDMIAYNDGSGVLGLHIRESGAGQSEDQAIAERAIDICDTYGITGVRPKLFADSNTWSDHHAFWKAGYPAVMVVQDFEQFDPRNHSVQDTVSHFVWPYYVGAAKMLLGTVASEAGLPDTPPATTASGVRDGAWHHEPTEVTLTAVSSAGGATVASISYAIDGGNTIIAPGSVVKLTVPTGDAADGPHVLVFHATDTAGNTELDHTLTVNLDTVGPVTRALASATAQRHGTARLRYRVNDAAPNGGTAEVVIKVKNAGGKVVQTANVGVQKVDMKQTAVLRVAVPRGAYRFCVYATDTAGNRQSSVGSANLLVK